MTVGPVGRNEATAEFFDGTARREFLLARCRPNGHWNRPQADRCMACGSDELSLVAGSGRARLVSWIVVHPRGGEGPVSVPAIVELDEGPWWWTQLVDVDLSSLREATPLEVRFERPEGSEAVPVFTTV